MRCPKCGNFSHIHVPYCKRCGFDVRNNELITLVEEIYFSTILNNSERNAFSEDGLNNTWQSVLKAMEDLAINNHAIASMADDNKKNSQSAYSHSFNPNANEEYIPSVEITHQHTGVGHIDVSECTANKKDDENQMFIFNKAFNSVLTDFSYVFADYKSFEYNLSHNIEKAKETFYQNKSMYDELKASYSHFMKIADQSLESNISDDFKNQVLIKTNIVKNDLKEFEDFLGLAAHALECLDENGIYNYVVNKSISNQTPEMLQHELYEMCENIEAACFTVFHTLESQVEGLDGVQNVAYKMINHKVTNGRINDDYKKKSNLLEAINLLEASQAYSCAAGDELVTSSEIMVSTVKTRRNDVDRACLERVDRTYSMVIEIKSAIENVSNQIAVVKDLIMTELS